MPWENTLAYLTRNNTRVEHHKIAWVSTSLHPQILDFPEKLALGKHSSLFVKISSHEEEKVLQQLHQDIYLLSWVHYSEVSRN
jgi:hypothetical protein